MTDDDGVKVSVGEMVLDNEFENERLRLTVSDMLGVTLSDTEIELERENDVDGLSEPDGD